MYDIEMKLKNPYMPFSSYIDNEIMGLSKKSYIISCGFNDSFNITYNPFIDCSCRLFLKPQISFHLLKKYMNKDDVIEWISLIWDDFIDDLKYYNLGLNKTIYNYT